MKKKLLLINMMISFFLIQSEPEKREMPLIKSSFDSVPVDHIAVPMYSIEDQNFQETISFERKKKHSCCSEKAFFICLASSPVFISVALAVKVYILGGFNE
jgi:hypothetical protein